VRAVAARQNDVVAYDIGEQTVKVLTEGLPALPDRFEPSQTLPVALWRGERNGAVLFLRLWRNGNYDSDCFFVPVVLKRAPSRHRPPCARL
jgi:hypothetical protein